MPQDFDETNDAVAEQLASSATDEPSEVVDGQNDTKNGDGKAERSDTEDPGMGSAAKDASALDASSSIDQEKHSNTSATAVGPYDGPIITSLHPSSLSIPVGGNNTFTVTISPEQGSDTVISLTLDPSDLVKVATEVTVPAGKTEQTFSIERLKAGSASITAKLNQSMKRAILEMPLEIPDHYQPWWVWGGKAPKKLSGNSKVRSIQKASYSLLGSFLILFLLFIVAYALLNWTSFQATLPIVLLFGALGSFISQQRRLREFSDEDFELFNYSSLYNWLSPIAGAILAGILYLMFIGELLAGGVFPKFEYSPAADNTLKTGIKVIFEIGSSKPDDYAKLLFWSFVAGYSERFVTDILGRFETQVDRGSEGSGNNQRNRGE